MSPAPTCFSDSWRSVPSDCYPNSFRVGSYSAWSGNATVTACLYSGYAGHCGTSLRLVYREFPTPFPALWWSACCPVRMTLSSPPVSLRTDREQQQGMPNACLSRCTSHRRFSHCELLLKVIRGNDVFMVTTFIPVGALLTTHQPSSFMSLPASHRPIRKPLSIAMVASQQNHGWCHVTPERDCLIQPVWRLASQGDFSSICNCCDEPRTCGRVWPQDTALWVSRLTRIVQGVWHQERGSLF